MVLGAIKLFHFRDMVPSRWAKPLNVYGKHYLHSVGYFIFRRKQKVGRELALGGLRGNE